MQKINLGSGVLKSMQQQQYPSLQCAVINATNYLEAPGIFVWDLLVLFISVSNHYYQGHKWDNYENRYFF